MVEHKIPANPQNYEIWFTHLTGRNPHLSQTLKILVSNGREFTPELSDEIYAQHFASVSKMTDDMMEVGDRMKEELDSLLANVEAALKNTSDYGDTLQLASNELVTQNQKTFKACVAQLVAATRHMEKHSRALETKLEASSKEVNLLRQNLDEIRHEALTDQLTGLANRKAFDGTLREAATDAMETGEPLCLLFSDIDHFKKFNDTWGHQTGDNVLRLVAKALDSNVKGRDTAARYGGEEFAVILPRTTLEDAVTLANEIRESVQAKELQRRSTGEILGTITISIGVAEFHPGESLNDFVHRADSCLYAAKRAGRNRVVAETDPVVNDFEDIEGQGAA